MRKIRKLQKFNSTMAIVAAQWRHYTCGEPRYFQ